MSLNVINDRLALVECLLDESFRDEITSLLRRSSDSLRLLTKFSIGKGDADDLLALSGTVQVTRSVLDALERRLDATQTSSSSETSDRLPRAFNALSGLRERLNLDGPIKLSTLITKAIDEDLSLIHI